MIEITLTVNKANVYNEVEKTTSYTGAKIEEGGDAAYDRIRTTDDDREMLERFWTEACNAATERMKRFVLSVTSYPESHGVEIDRNYEVRLELSSSFDTALTQSAETSLYSFFVTFIVARWFKLANKEEADSYAADAAALMDDVMRKLFYKKKPTRVIPT